MTIYKVPVRISHAGGGGDAYNIMNFRTIGPGGDDLDQLGEAINALTTFYSAIKALYPNTTTINIGESVIKDPLGAPEYVGTDAKVVQGTRTGGSSPTLLAVTCTWRTTSATRSGRGRTFIGPLGFGVVQNDGTLNDADIATLRNAANAFVNASLGPAGWSFGVLSQKQKLLRDVTSFTVRDRFAYLSSRRD